ncbi:hypothetical protein P3S67_006780 [Capsicum chacoense]
MATGAAPFSLSGATHVKGCEPWSAKSSSFVKTPMVAIQRKSNSKGTKAAKLSIRANYSDQRGRGGSGGDFVAGFLLGGAIFGTLGYIYAPQIRRSLLNEDEYGFRRAKRPIYYYDEGLEKTRQTLNTKLDQLNSAIDKVSSVLRGGNKMPAVPVETDPEEATM